MGRRLRIVATGWETYTGPLCGHNFTDGVSEDSLAQHVIDRIGALVTVELIRDNGVSKGQVGPLERMLKSVDTPAPQDAPMEHPTNKELKEERARDALVNSTQMKIYAEEELHALAEKTGIKGLREIGDKWNVRERAIPGLIKEILRAQHKWRKEQAAKDAERRAAREKALGDSLAQVAANEEDVELNARRLSSDETPNAIGPNGEPIYVKPEKLETADIVDAADELAALKEQGV